MDRRYVWLKTYRHKVRVSIYHGFGTKCGICKYDKCLRALTLHHLDPQTKKFSFSAWSSHNFQTALDEAEKCVMLCANCHAEVEDGAVALSKNITRFDRDSAIKMKATLTPVKTRRKYLCPDCSGSRSRRSTRCWECHLARTRSRQTSVV